MQTKQQQIKAKLIKPIEVGDRVKISIPYTYTENITEGKGKKKVTTTVTKEAIFANDGKVNDISDNTISIGIFGSPSIPSAVDKIIKTEYKDYGKLLIVPKEFVKPTINECGSNPFKKETFRVDFYNQDLSSILFKACYGKRDNDFMTPEYKGDNYGGLNLDPFVIDENGQRVYFQRGLVWSLEQKQLLIDSIYNGIEIGKFLFRYRSWNDIQAQIKETGHGYNWDCVDGKQRFSAILDFVQNKFADSYGNYWKDLSENAQDKFLGYSKLAYGQMGENAKDSDVLESFLTMNHAGTPMSPEHLEFVKSIKL